MAVAAETTDLGMRENFAALLDELLGVATGTSGSKAPSSRAGSSRSKTISR